MNDEQIAEYLRSRARVRPPMDLVGAIADAVEGVPQRRRSSWFAPFVPAGAAVAAAAVVLVAAVLVGQEPDSGPAPGGSPTETPTVATMEPTPSPSTAPTLLEPGDSVTIDALDPEGPWGTVTVTRGEDLGGYDDGSVSPDGFVVEVHVEYAAAREPDPAEFGGPDWTLTAGTNRTPVGEVLQPRSRVARDRPFLGTYPGAIDIFTTPLDGWMLFEVPRDLGDEALELRYRPTGFAETVIAFPLRDPGPAPDPVALATPAPTPEPVNYVEKQGYPFSVIDSAGADALFEIPDTCTNPVAGYTVTYPDAWFTNTEIGEWPPCTWFSPVFYDVGDDPNEVPPQVAIVLVFADMAYGYVEDPEMTIDEVVTVDSYEARRSELIGFFTLPDGEYMPEPATYFYTVYIGDQGTQPTLRATTSFEDAADYELNKAVVDRIMALIQFEE